MKNLHHFYGTNEVAIMDLIKSHKSDALIKKGTFSTEIIWEGKSYVFPAGSKKQMSNFKSGLYLFPRVRKDAALFLKRNPKFKLPKHERSIIYNDENYIDGRRKVTATDLNHAYWRIALNLGVISDETYEKALDKKYKSIRLAALSTLGAGRTYQIISNGKITDSSIKNGEDDDLKRVYKLIRYTCYKHMMKLATKLAAEFLAYKTDCIYYYDTPENRKIVSEYFDKNGLTFKQLS